MKNISQVKIKKLIVFLLIFVLVFGQALPAWGYDPEPTPPPAPEAPLSPPAPTGPEPITLAEATTPEPSPLPTATPLPPTLTPTPEPVVTGNENPPTPALETNGPVGETSITTQDTTNSVVVEDEGSLIQEATPSGEIIIAENQETVQENLGEVVNTIQEATDTGQNSASLNVGDSTVITGDANIQATVITGVNTNLEGVTVAEFNIVNDQTGDIVLDFNPNLVWDENGSSDQGNEEVNYLSQEENFQTNEALVENDITLASATGGNETSKNTNGDSTIITGDANVAANIVNFLNNNLAGSILLGVVNIFGNLIGDIILPQEVFSPAAGQTQIDNLNESQLVFQSNDVEIENNLNLNADTGGNEANLNTGGDSTIQTGQAQTGVQVLNVANANISGGNWWMVIVNQAGQWLGKILGAPEGANFAFSPESDFAVNTTDGIITVSSPQPDPQVNYAVSQTVSQTNQARLVNNLDLSASTGGNKASENTNTDSAIKTGDAQILVNLINFVNSNISSDGKLAIALVNVFGSWTGDFLPPGTKKETPPPDDGDGGDGDDDSDSGSDDSTDPGSDDESPAEDEEVEEEIPLDEEEFETGTDDEIGLVLADELVVGEGDALAAPAAGLGAENGPKPIQVNLAWLVIAVPGLLLSIFLKKRLFR